MILRRAVADDAGGIARVHRQAMRVSLSFLPELHTPEQDLRFMRERLMTQNEVWVAEVAGEVAGYVAFHEGWIDHLYVHPDHQARGLGPRLLAKAMEDGTERRLWTFQQNARARAFYEKRGFVAEEFTDGEGNEEKTPDVRYVWRP
ncbi:MAG TPA: GNAT family N-acetyltransferase [Phenylobacterium sp.]|nr:GNAT family N-acetyltransferase [Phenylobacterium sp.]